MKTCQHCHTQPVKEPGQRFCGRTCANKARHQASPEWRAKLLETTRRKRADAARQMFAAVLGPLSLPDDVLLALHREHHKAYARGYRAAYAKYFYEPLRRDTAKPEDVDRAATIRASRQ